MFPEYLLSRPHTLRARRPIAAFPKPKPVSALFAARLQPPSATEEIRRVSRFAQYQQTWQP